MAISFFRGVPETAAAVVIVLREDSRAFLSQPASNLSFHNLQHKGGNQISVF